jgi:hypothetical protein
MRSSPNTTASHLLRRYRASVGRRGHVFSQGPWPAWHRWKHIFCIPAEYACGWDLMAFMKSQMNNVFGGVLTFYLVATAWATARRRDAKTGILDWVALLVALALGTLVVTYRVEAANSSTGAKDGFPAGMYFLLGSVALLSAAGDVRMLWHGGVSGAQRIARHLWRMCFAVSIASSSLVFGTATTVPGVIAQDGDSFSAGCPAADLDDFLAGSRVVHECVQKDFVTKPSSWEPAWGPQASLASS